MSRKITKTYQDPIELIWIHCANSIGIQVARDDEVFASWDGAQVLRLGLESLDADDSVAQLIFHEICHAIVEGPGAFEKPDWGLNEGKPAARTHEFATLRLQAWLADQFELRDFLAATTDFREYFDQIPHDAYLPIDCSGTKFERLRQITPAEDDEAIQLAKNAQSNLDDSPWKKELVGALAATKKIFDVARFFASTDSLWHDGSG